MGMHQMTSFRVGSLLCDKALEKVDDLLVIGSPSTTKGCFPINIPKMEVVHIACEKPDHLLVPLHYNFVKRRIFSRR